MNFKNSTGAKASLASFKESISRIFVASALEPLNCVLDFVSYCKVPVSVFLRGSTECAGLPGVVLVARAGVLVLKKIIYLFNFAVKNSFSRQ